MKLIDSRTKIRLLGPVVAPAGFNRGEKYVFKEGVMDKAA
jgi:hypothetical protein